MGKVFIGILVIVLSEAASAEVSAHQESIHQAQSWPDQQPQGPENDGQALHLALEWNESVERYINYFSGPGKAGFQRWLDNSARSLPLIRAIFRDENLPEELVYVAMIESGFSPAALSRAKAAGPWQLMQRTAKSYGLKNDAWRDERKDLAKSTRAAAMLFKDLHESLNSWPLVLAAYNAGIGNVQRALTRSGATDFWTLRKSTHLKRETKNFVPKFMAAALIAKDPGLYGFRVGSAETPEHDQIVLAASTDLTMIASWTGSTYEKIKSLNPEINGRFTPPDDPLYYLNIPPGTKKRFQAGSDAIAKPAFSRWLAKPFPRLYTGNDRNRSTFPRAGICSLTGSSDKLFRLVKPAPATAVALSASQHAKETTDPGQALALCDYRASSGF